MDLHCLGRIRQARLAKCIALTLGPVALLCGVSPAAFAQCTTSSTTITCATGSNTNSYANSINNVTVDVNTGAVLSVPPIVGGAALTLNGTGITLNNQGTIDPTVNGGLSLAASGAVLGNSSASNITINNQSGGTINGLVNIASILGFGGQALVVQNAGSSTLYNSGSIGMSIFGVGTFTTADAPAIVSYGGGQMNISNSGSITGRIGFLGSTVAGFGNNILNAGTINGSVYLGNSVSGNSFTAVSGSSVNTAGVSTAGTMTIGASTINFAAAGVVDGGTGSGNQLVLQNSSTGTGSGLGGPVTTISASKYLDFQNLTVNSGTWNLQGNLVSGSATINDGLVNFNSAGVFGSGGLTVNGGGLEAATAGLSLANSVTLNGGLSLDGANAFSLAGSISGNGALTVNDTAPVTLGGSNLFSGGVNLNAGGLVLGNANALGTGALAVGGSASLNTQSGFALANNITVNAGTLALLGSNPLTLNGDLSGAGSLSWNGAGTLTLNGIDNLMGSLLLNSGTLAVGAGSSLSPTGAVSLAAGSTLDISLASNQSIGSLAGAGGTVNLGVNTLTLNGLGNTVFNGSITGLGGLVKLGSGTQTLGGASVFSGGVDLAAGGLVLGNNVALGTGALNVSGTATLDGATTLTLPNNVNLNAGGNLDLLGGQSVTLNGTVLGTGSLTKDGASLLTLNGSNSFSGGLSLNAGGVVLGNSGALGTGTLTVNGSATLDGSTALALTNQVSLGTGGSLILPGAVNVALNGVVSGTGSLAKNGGSTVTLNGANLFSGGVTLGGGSLLLGNSSALGTGALSVNGNATLDSTGSALDLYNTILLGAGNTLTLPGTQQLTLEGAITGVGGIAKNGAQTLILNNADTFTGGLSINAGTAALGTNGSLASTGAVSLTNPGAALDVSGAASNPTIGGLSGVAGTSVFLGFNTLTMGSVGNQSFGGTIGGTGGVIKQGNGTETLTGTNTFTGDLTVNAGTLAIGLGGALAGGVNVNLGGAGAALNLSAGSSQSIGSLSGVAGTTVALGANALTLNSSGNATFGGAITGTGGLIKNGVGTQTLNGASTFSGGVALNAGGLVVGNNAALGTGALNVNGAVTLGASSNVAAANNMVLGVGAGLTVQGGNPLTLGGVISGSGSLALNGSSTLSLTGADTYTGGTNILAGTLALGTGGSLLSTGAVTLAGTGTLDISAGGNQTIGSLAGASASGTVNLGSSVLTLGNASNTDYAGVITGTGSLIKNGTGTLTLDGANNYSGGTTINAGTLQGSTTSLQGNIVNNAALLFNQNTSGSYGGVISGSGTLTTSGTGTVTLNGINTATGLTTVMSGSTLLVGDSTHTTAQLVGDVSVNGGTFGGYGVALGSVMLSNGATLAPGAPQTLGSLTVGGDLTIGSGSKLNFDFGAAGPNFSTPGQSDHVVVAGNLSIDTSTLNINNLGSMGPGLYQLFQWGSTLSITGGGFAPPSGMSLQVLTVGRQINLVDMQGFTLNEWDANGLAGPGQMGGGSGTWSLFSNTWSDTTGQFVGPMSPQPGFAIFGGAPGTVSVDDSSGTVGATGMQFVSDGYHLTGGTIDLVGQGSAAPVMRVSSGDTAIIDNVLDGTAGLNKTDGGTLVLTGSNVFTGTTTLSGGYLSVSSDANLGASTNALDFEGGTLEVTGTTFTQTARNITWGNPGGGFDIDSAANVFTVGQTLGGNGGLLKSGAGTLVLTGTDTYAGGTVINSGVLALSGNGSIANSADITVAAGASFDIGNTSGGASIVSLDGSGIVNLGAKTLTLTNASGYFTGMIAGAGGLSISGGNETLAGPAIYGGITAINGGTLSLAGSTTLLNSPDVVIASGGTLDISGTTSGTSIVSLDGAGAVNLGSKTLTLVSAAGNFSGTIGGTGGFAVTGGAETLSGNNTYQGGTSINGASLSVSGDSNLGDASGGLALNDAALVNSASFNTARNIALSNNGTFDTVGDLTVSGVISGPGMLTKNGMGYLVLTGTNTYGGSTTINAGTLQVGNNGASGSITGDVMVGANGLLAFFRSDALDYAGAISGSGALVQNAGVLTLDGASAAFSGMTVVNGGSLVVGGAAGNGATLGGTMFVSGGATLGGTGSVGNVIVANGGIVNPGSAAAGSFGTLTVNGDLRAIQGAQFDFDFGASGASFQAAGTSDSVKVVGNLELDGATLNVNNAGGMGPGLYNVFSYGGTLLESNGGLSLGNTGGQTLLLQNLTSQKQINLIDTTGLTLDIWNANGQASATRMGGGSGTWSVTSPTWTDALGTVPNMAMQPQPGFAVFGGTPGTVTVDNGAGKVSATGMQFAVDGYTLSGGALTLIGSNGSSPVIRVGDGSGNGTTMTATIASVLAGSAGLDKTDLGTLVLSGANTYAGGTTISGGTLSVANDGNLGDASGGIALQGGTLENTAAFTTNRAISLAGNGTLQTDANLTVSNVITGSGALTKSGAGTLTLGGSNTYSGGTTISGGTLSVSGDGNLGATSGSITLDGGVLETSGTFATARAFNMVGSGTWQTDADITASGAISGNGALTKSGAGTLIMDSNSSGFAGSTTVQAGTLEVGDASTPSAVLGGNVTVASGGTLSGHGTIAGNVTNSGLVWAGGSIGTLTIAGNYTQAANGLIEVEAAPTGQISQLIVGGKASLAGSALVLADAGAWVPRTDYTLLTAAGGISGQFASVSSSLAFLTPTLGYGANAVTLSLQRNDVNLNAVAQTANQRAVATAANPLGFTSPVYNALVVLDAATARSAFGQLSGEIHASARTAIMDDDRYVRDAINQHLAGMTNDANGLNVTNDGGVTAWTAVWGHWGSHDSDGNAAGFTANGSGVLMGADLPVGDDARLGAVIGSGQGTVRIATPGSSSHVLDQHFGIYGSAQTGPLQWQGGALYGLQRVDSSRTVGFGSFAGAADGNYHAHSAQGYVDASWPIALGNTTLSPFANLAYENLHTPSFTESGSSAALSVASQDSSVGYGTLGLRASFDLGAPSHGLHAHVGLGWQHAWGDTLPTTTMRFASGSDSFDIAGLPVARNAGTVRGGISFTITPAVSVDASYQGQFGQRASDQAARVSVDWRF